MTVGRFYPAASDVKNAVDGFFFPARLKLRSVFVLINDQFFQRQHENTEAPQNLSSTVFHTY